MTLKYILELEVCHIPMKEAKLHDLLEILIAYPMNSRRLQKLAVTMSSLGEGGPCAGGPLK